MKIYTVIIAAFFGFLLTSCSKDDVSKSAAQNVIYFNSFESEADLDDFIGFFNELDEDVAEGAGESSLMISGGCIAPHLYIDLGPFDEDKSLKLSVFGKNISENIGSVYLYSVEDHTLRAEISVSGSDWLEYNSSTMLLPQNEILRLEFTSGGIAANITLFDEVMITQE